MTIREVIKDMNITNKYDYRIGFINADGQEDETELSADSNEDLVNTYETFCEDNGFPKDTITYIGQKPDFITATIFENIALGRITSKEEIKKSLKLSNAIEFVNQKENSLNFIL